MDSWIKIWCFRTINSYYGHSVGGKNFIIKPKSLCRACLIGKKNLKSLHLESIKVVSCFLKRIQGDICGPIQQTCGPFKYFTKLVYVSTRWLYVVFLSKRNAKFPKLLTQIVKLMARNLDYLIKSIRLDNVAEFTLKMFDAYCMPFWTDLDYLIIHVHFENGFVEEFIKLIQIIVITLVMCTKLPILFRVMWYCTYSHQTTLCVLVGNWIWAWCLTFTHVWVLSQCSNWTSKAFKI